MPCGRCGAADIYAEHPMRAGVSWYKMPCTECPVEPELEVAGTADVLLGVRLVLSQHSARFAKTWQVYVGDHLSARGLRVGAWKDKVRSHLAEVGVPAEEIAKIVP